MAAMRQTPDAITKVTARLPNLLFFRFRQSEREGRRLLPGEDLNDEPRLGLYSRELIRFKIDREQLYEARHRHHHHSCRQRPRDLQWR